MKTAIILSGHMRSFERCLPTLHWHVFRHFPAADFYVSTEPDENAPKVALLSERYGSPHVHIDQTAQPPIVVPPEWEHAAAHAPYAISVPPLAVVGQLWRLNHTWTVFGGLNTFGNFDCIIRCRPDSFFHSFVMPERRVLKYSGGIAQYGGFIIDAYTPWWGRFGGVNDRFAILSTPAAFNYFATFHRIHAYVQAGCPLHPESLIARALEESTCNHSPTLRAEFSTLRANGETRPPEITAIDLARVGAA